MKPKNEYERWLMGTPECWSALVEEKTASVIASENRDSFAVSGEIKK